MSCMAADMAGRCPVRKVCQSGLGFITNYITITVFAHVGYGIQPGPGSWVLGEGNIIERSRTPPDESPVVTTMAMGATVEFRLKHPMGTPTTRSWTATGTTTSLTTRTFASRDSVRIHHNTSTFTNSASTSAGHPALMCRVLQQTVLRQ